VNESQREKEREERAIVTIAPDDRSAFSVNRECMQRLCELALRTPFSGVCKVRVGYDRSECTCTDTRQKRRLSVLRRVEQRYWTAFVGPRAEEGCGRGQND
jgi:hypothetical protein